MGSGWRCAADTRWWSQLCASAALALSGLGIESASAATRPSLALSLSPDRSGAVRLDGSTVRGKIYVFVKNSQNIGKVDFYLDGRWRTKPPVQTDTSAPFDFAGTAADGTALPYETTKLADGSHTIRAVLTWSDGTSSSRRWDFTVANSGATATTTASPTAPTTTPPATTTAAPTTATTASPTTTATAAPSTSTTALATPSASATPTLSTPTSSPITSMITNSFETGNFKGWNLCQWNAGGSIRNDNCQTYSGAGEYPATVVNESAEHPQSARFELRNGDIPFGGTERAEIARPGGSALSNVVEGDERWISFDLKFDSRWPVAGCRLGMDHLLPMARQRLTSSPPLALDIDTDDVIYLANNDSSGYQRTAVQSVVRNQWQRWVIHAKFSDDDAVGFADVTIDGAPILPRTSMATMIPGEPSNYLKIGIYRDPVNTATAILYYDNFSIRK